MFVAVQLLKLQLAALRRSIKPNITMRISVVAAVACAAAAAAHDDFDSIYQPSKGEIVQVGSTVEIKWNVLTNVDGPVNITLSAGADGDSLDLVDTLACK